ncbi:MAG: hypothetical protein OXJ54_07950 [Gemmatimonadetes bacterium]|nr:hypothetical protein [Candidatus Palauibacter rhopaloidicola]
MEGTRTVLARNMTYRQIWEAYFSARRERQPRWSGVAQTKLALEEDGKRGISPADALETAEMLRRMAERMESPTDHDRFVDVAESCEIIAGKLQGDEET